MALNIYSIKTREPIQFSKCTAYDYEKSITAEQNAVAMYLDALKTIAEL